jgi:transcription initiation factor TFIID subunit 1
MDGNLSFGDTTGKVDDAVDYEDISDDDLPSEDEATNRAGGVGDDDGGDILADLAKQEGEDDAMGEYDDLFGEMEPMSDQVAPATDLNIAINGDMSFDFDDRTAAAAATAAEDDDDLFRGFDFGNEMAMPQPEQIQQQNFSPEELAMQYFPTFKPNSSLSFISLFLNKTASLQKAPQKIPKVCVPTKINIEMALDDENTFSKKGMPAAVEKPIIEIPPLADPMDLEDQEREQEASESMDPVAERDLEIACDDWESKIEAAMATPPSSPPPSQRLLHEEDIDEEFDIEDRSPKVSLY